MVTIKQEQISYIEIDSKYPTSWVEYKLGNCAKKIDDNIYEVSGDTSCVAEVISKDDYEALQNILAYKTIRIIGTDTPIIKRTDLPQFIKLIGGKIFSVIFTKKDGTERKMVARLKVKKFLKGGENKVEAPDRPYKVVFDLQAKGYRTINYATIKEIHFQGQVIKVVEE